MNKLVGITLGAVAVYGIVRLLKMQNVGDQTNISLVNPRVHAVNLGGFPWIHAIKPHSLGLFRRSFHSTCLQRIF
jgi:hypothetical protein